MISDDIKQDIHRRLSSLHPEMKEMRMGPFSQILGGATHTIFAFDMISVSESIPLILRIYTPAQAEGAKTEFRAMEMLYNEGLQVARPYLIAMDSTAMGSPYVILERIVGPMLSDVLMGLRSGQRFDQLLTQYTSNMAALHAVDWSKGYQFLDARNISNEPEAFSLRELARPREIVEEHDAEDLRPALDWLEQNAPDTRNLCLIHGDYHSMNIIVRNETELVTIDWNSARIGDYRMDLAYAIITLTSADLDVKEKILNQYTEATGKEVEDLEYFTALSSIWNLLRMYSCLLDRRVMGETDETVRLFIGEYHNYSRLTIETVQRITGVDLSRLLEKMDSM